VVQKSVAEDDIEAAEVPETFFDVRLADRDSRMSSDEFLDVFLADFCGDDATVALEEESCEVADAGAHLEHTASLDRQIE
jgi:hypothetical protein